MNWINEIAKEEWAGYYQVTENYEMHITEIECCNRIAQAISEEIEKRLNDDAYRKIAKRLEGKLTYGNSYCVEAYMSIGIIRKALLGGELR